MAAAVELGTEFEIELEEADERLKGLGFLGVSQNRGVPFLRLPIIRIVVFGVHIGVPLFRETTKWRL